MSLLPLVHASAQCQWLQFVLSKKEYHISVDFNLLTHLSLSSRIPRCGEQGCAWLAHCFDLGRAESDAVGY